MAKLVWLDAGHGGKDSGGIGNGLMEKNIVLAMAKRVGAILTGDYTGVDVKFTRTTDVFYELTERTNMANKAEADLFISFHTNAGGGTGYEDFVHDTKASQASKDFQEKIHNNTSPIVAKYGLKNRGKKTANYAVLRQTDMPAALVETAFIDTDDAKLLKNAAFIEEMCQAYAAAIASQLGGKKKAAAKPVAAAPKADGTVHCVQVGAYSDKANAEAMAAKLEKAGFKDVVIK
jgi:N-acetylmuramoyl-L-alanine amidase